MIVIMEPHLVISGGGKIATACSLPGKINPTRPVRVPVWIRMFKIFNIEIDKIFNIKMINIYIVTMSISL